MSPDAATDRLPVDASRRSVVTDDKLKRGGSSPVAWVEMGPASLVTLRKELGFVSGLSDSTLLKTLFDLLAGFRRFPMPSI